IALGVIGSLLITPFYHPDDLAILVPAAWLWMHTAPALRERIVMAAGLGGALLIGTPLPLILCLLAALLPVVDRVSARRVSLREAAGSTSGGMDQRPVFEHDESRVKDL